MSETGEKIFTGPASGDSGASAAVTQGKKKKRKGMEGTSSAGAKAKTKKNVNKDPTGLLAPSNVRKPLSGFNLAGRPGLLKDVENGRGIKSLTKKVVRPLSNSTINNDSEWTFVINSNKKEFIRFYANSMTCSLYSVRANAAYDVNGADDKIKAVNHSTVALDGEPTVFLDPSLMGTSFVKSVRVSINGVPVQTNNLVDPHLLHYVRCARIFNTHPEPYLSSESKVKMAADRHAHSLAMKTGLKPFDHVTWNQTSPNRIPIYLDGIWPFDHRCRTIESIDQEPEPPLYLPPDSRIEVTVELHRNKMAAVFHQDCNDYTEYYSNGNRAASVIKSTFVDVMLEYESCELSGREYEEVIKQYREGKVGNYDYDIVRSQHQTLEAGVAYSVKWFQIYPHCRLAYIMFLPNFGTFPMPATNKPLSGWSRFPRGCTNMKLEFAGESNLITEDLINFGVNNNNNEISKKIFFDYLTANHMFTGTFEDFFSIEENSQSILQIVPVDLKHLDSAKTERLTVELNFATADNSPAGVQILVLSVHTNGRAICSASKDVADWKWEFVVL